MECPNGGMTSGAMHQAGSQQVAVPNLTHPQSTIYMGWDKGGILPPVESKEVRTNVLLGP
jgi:hypothetical protein